LSLRQSFQLLCDSQSHPGGRLSLPRPYHLAKKTGRSRNVTEARGPTFHEKRLNAPVRPCVDGSPLARVFLGASATLVGAAMCPTCFAAHNAAGHNAIRVSGPDQKLALEVLGRNGFS
jgi:hypothetical protein